MPALAREPVEQASVQTHLRAGAGDGPTAGRAGGGTHLRGDLRKGQAGAGDAPTIGPGRPGGSVAGAGFAAGVGVVERRRLDLDRDAEWVRTASAKPSCYRRHLTEQGGAGGKRACAKHRSGEQELAGRWCREPFRRPRRERQRY
jgi:hypothetical protein